MTMTHMCLVDPDEDEAHGAELGHGQLGEQGHHSLAAGILAFPALVDKDCLHMVKLFLDVGHIQCMDLT